MPAPARHWPKYKPIVLSGMQPMRAPCSSHVHALFIEFPSIWSVSFLLLSRSSAFVVSLRARFGAPSWPLENEKKHDPMARCQKDLQKSREDHHKHDSE